MKTAKVLTWACMVLFAGVISNAASAGKLALNDRVSAGSWVEKSGISIAPLYLTKPDGSVSCLSLDEATKADLIEVMETSEVNQLLVENKGKKPILLLAGEVVGGGKQDRMVGKDLILGPGKIRRIAVFCVEHGRWTAGAEKTGFQSASVMADKDIRQMAQPKGGSAENQSGVWNEVGKALAHFDASAPTSNYQEIKKTEKFKESEPMVEDFLKTFGDDPDLAGFALAYNGEVQSLEYFANPALARKYREKLIRSYVTSALKDLAESKTVPLSALKEFLAADLSGETHQYKGDDEIVIESNSKGLSSFELQTPKGALVHYARYAK